MTSGISSVRYFIAPLPAFVLLGFELTRSAKVTIVNPKHLTNQFEAFPLDGSSNERFFTESLQGHNNQVVTMVVLEYL